MEQEGRFGTRRMSVRVVGEVLYKLRGTLGLGRTIPHPRSRPLTLTVNRRRVVLQHV